MHGMFRNPPPADECPKCTFFSNNVGGVNRGFVHVMEMKSLWLDWNKLTNQNVFKIISDVIRIYAMFYDFYINIDGIMQDEELMDFPVRLV